MSPAVESLVTFQVRWGSATHAGVRREVNEDAVLARPPVFVVADGMGGHSHGREAADLVVGAFDAVDESTWLTPAALQRAIDIATERVGAFAAGLSGAPGSTVTGVGLACHQGLPSWLVFNIGDSRTYRMHRDRLEQVTVDHSRQQELVDSGLSTAQAIEKVSGNVITRAIGGGLRSTPRVDQWLLPAMAGDRMLLCSDGLTGELTDQLVEAILRSCADPADAARQLVEAAVTAGGRDNVSVVVVDAVEVDGSTIDADRLEGDTLSDGHALGPSGNTLPDQVEEDR